LFTLSGYLAIDVENQMFRPSQPAIAMMPEPQNQGPKKSQETTYLVPERERDLKSKTPKARPELTCGTQLVYTCRASQQEMKPLTVPQ